MKDDLSIQFVEHKAIDKQLWDTKINAAVNGLIYAQAYYLDAMSKNWNALVTADYEYIMPLTAKNKFGIAYLCQPAFCQQLGIFSDKKITKEIQESFIKKAQSHYKFIEIQVNNLNTIEHAEIRTNFLLNLNRPYEVISADYKNDLSKNLKKACKHNLVYAHSNNIKNALELYKATYNAQMKVSETNFFAFEQLCKLLKSRNKVFCRKVMNENGYLLSIGLFLKDNKRIYNIASITLQKGREMEANHFLLDAVINEFSNQPLIFDFEGSDIPGVADFYLKFNPEKETYYFYRQNNLPAIIKWMK